MMNTCYSASTYGLHRKDWVRSYFDAKPTHPAGTLWFYDSSGSYVMGALVKRLTELEACLARHATKLGCDECFEKRPDGPCAKCHEHKA